MNPEIAIREARLEDAEAFVRAHEVAWDATIAPMVGRSLRELMPFEARVDAYRASIRRASDQAKALVAERDDRIIGVAVVLRQGPEAVELRDLYVVPGAWGTGVGGQLMDAALASISSEADDAFLWVGKDNHRARRFYEREGWLADGELRASQLGSVEVRYRRRAFRP